MNECELTDHNQCEQVCVELRSGYRCDCNPGYEVDPEDDTKCVDINECNLRPR